MNNKKIKKKPIFILIIFTILIIIIIVNPIKLYNKHELKKLGFNKQSIEIILSNKLKDEIFEIGYNETLDKVLIDIDFNINNFSIYKDIKYYELDNFTNSINKLISIGYNVDQINAILKKANNQNLSDFLNHEYIEDIEKYLIFDFAKLSYIDRYIKYDKENTLDKETVVINVNIGLDKDYYQDTDETHEFSFDMLVNKYHGLSDDFTPLDLVNVPANYGEGEKLNETVLKAFIKMSDDCKTNTNYKLLVRSGYRSYSDQEKLYNSYLKTYGKTYTENYVTHPGFSEHHTGLAVDIKAESSDVFISSKESKWVYENAYKYGFILRYKKDYENITGIKYESWHFRYVGEIASYLQEHDMTFEEYYVRFIEK